MSDPNATPNPPWYDRLWNQLWAKLKLGFEELLGLATVFTSALTADIARNGGLVLQDAAIEAVKALEGTSLDNNGKHQSAFEAIVAVLQKEGLPVVERAIDGAIVAAVAQIRAGDQAPPVASPADVQPTPAAPQ